MRALALWAALVAGCHALDAARPIALLPASDWSDGDRAILQNAADCWNRQFGTGVGIGVAHDAGQLITVDYNDFVCLEAAGRTEIQPPVHISLCRHPPRGSDLTFWLFRAVVHELGHALNIYPHAADQRSVMANYPKYVPEDFTADDCRLFRDANGVLPGGVPCGSVHINWLAGEIPNCD